MKLFLLTRTDHVGYDENQACVVRASSEDHARSYAFTHLKGDESPAIWKDLLLVKCREVGIAIGEEGLGFILVDFNAG